MRHNLWMMLKGCGYTFAVSMVSLVLGFALGLLIGVISCRHIKKGLISFLGSSYVSLVRGTPLFIQILIIYFGLPSIIRYDLSPLTAGVIALGCNSAAYLAEIIRGGINILPQGQWEAAKVLGYGKFGIFIYILLPQALRGTLPSLTNEFVTLIKESSILMVLGIPELTKISRDIVSREMNPMEIYLLCAGFYLIMTTVVSSVAGSFENKGKKLCG